MTAILPFLTLIAIFWLFRKKFPQFDLRLVFFLSAAAWGLLLVLITEISSLFHAFNYRTLSAAWAFLTGALGVAAFYRWKKIEFKPLRFTVLQWVQVICIAGISAATLIIAVVSAPNNWDAMVYHMSRVAHWAQNESVAHYPTSVLRQLYNPPFAEYQIAHLQILSGSDRLAQLPQWLSLIGCVMGVSLITKQLGGSKAAQILAAFFTATLPMGILQASTTQNDYVAAFWLVAVIAVGLEVIRSPEKILPVGWGLCLGLAALTKTSVYFFGLPFMLYFIARGLTRHKARFIPAVVAVSLIALSINAPHFIRNFNLFGSPFGPSEELSRHQNEDLRPQGFAGNVIRNLGLYAGTVESINQAVNSGVQGVYNWMETDVNDSRYTLSGYQFTVARPEFHEDTLGSSWHLALAVITLVILLSRRKDMQSRLFLHYGLLTLAGFLLFCLLIRWMPWNVRLHLPLLVISAAWVGLLADLSRKWVMWVLTAFLAVMVLPVFYFNPNKPLVADYNIFNLPRREVMITRKNLVVPYIESVNYLVDEKDCYQTGLYLPDQEWEYPFWSLYADTGKPFRLEHVNVQNETAEIPMPSFAPCAVIATQSTGDTFTSGDGTVYHLTWNMDPVFVYTR